MANLCKEKHRMNKKYSDGDYFTLRRGRKTRVDNCVEQADYLFYYVVRNK